MILKGEALEMINSVTDKNGKQVSKKRSCGDRESNSITLWKNYGVQAIKRLIVTETTGKNILEKRSCGNREQLHYYLGKN
jgi:hypothetical protein